MVDEIVAIRTKSDAPVWGWGGFYRTIKDTMHYEIVCTPADLATGIVNAPTSGGFGTMTDAEIEQQFIDSDERAKAREAVMLTTLVDYLDAVAVAQGVDPKVVRRKLGPKAKKVLTSAQKLHE